MRRLLSVLALAVVGSQCTGAGSADGVAPVASQEREALAEAVKFMIEKYRAHDPKATGAIGFAPLESRTRAGLPEGTATAWRRVTEELRTTRAWIMMRAGRVRKSNPPPEGNAVIISLTAFKKLREGRYDAEISATSPKQWEPDLLGQMSVSRFTRPLSIEWNGTKWVVTVR